MPDADPLLTVTQAASHLGVSEKTVYRLAERHEIEPVEPVDHRKRFRKSDLDGWLDRRRRRERGEESS